MKLSLPILSDSDPLPFHYRDLISINFRKFTMWLLTSYLPDDSYQVISVVFPWTDTARAFNQKDRHNALPHAAKSMVEDIDTLLEDSPCVVICAQISKLFCEVAIATPDPQLVHSMLGEMACPADFAVPVLNDAAVTPSEYIAQHTDIA
ncbi:hypothetical protein [Alteromonas sp. H39]|uniref:hypothetical protein n=1 Tax=Alteromonas sp. H39 TaxID=3389876 RepID=UPI0039E030BF